MSHPEIPKDHPRFKFHTVDEFASGDQCFLCIEHEYIPLVDLSTLERQDCAAHAAAWWLNRSWQFRVDTKESAEARIVAQAWLAWGAQK